MLTDAQRSAALVTAKNEGLQVMAIAPDGYTVWFSPASGMERQRMNEILQEAERKRGPLDL